MQSLQILQLLIVEWGFYRTHADIYINTDKNINDISYTSGQAALRGRWKYSITITDKGIILNSYGDPQCKSMRLYRTDERKFGDTTSKTIRFAISREIIPEINDKCGYFVGIGANDLSTGFQKSSATFVGSIAPIESSVTKNNGSCNDGLSIHPSYFDILMPYNESQIKNYNIYSIENRTIAKFNFIYNK